MHVCGLFYASLNNLTNLVRTYNVRTTAGWPYVTGNYVSEGERKVMDPMKEMEYVPTYEDKDGDWMLVGDVPWK